MKPLPAPTDRYVHLWWTDALTPRRPHCSAFPYRYAGLGQHWVSSIGVPIDFSRPFSPRLVGWSDVTPEESPR